MPYSPDQPEEPDATAPFDRPPAGDATARIDRPLDDSRLGDTRVGGEPAGGDGAGGEAAGGGAAGGGAAGGEPPRWSGRANVPRPGDPGLRQPAPQEWVEEEDPYQGRSWFTPVIVGMVALVLVAALTIGVWLIYRATEDNENAPTDEASLPQVSSSAPAPTRSTAPATTAPPTSAAPTRPTAAPGTVVIPRLRGDTLAEATVKLQVLGLNVTAVRRVDASVQPGEVIESTPPEGATVAAGDTVTLVVAVAPSPAPSKLPSSPAG